MRDLWIASGNAKKVAELVRLLQPHGFRIRSMAELPSPPPIREDRPDFAGNAAVKARTLARAVSALALGDDSGLCVDALGGAPGVLSARYAGPSATDGDRIARLLRELHGIPWPRRTARFVCALCVAAADGGIVAAVEDRCEGFIAEAPRGVGGFGYDPVFIPLALCADDPGAAPSFAQLDPDVKDRLSHRGKALARLAQTLSSWPADDVL
jgi:XTP/dITP diphosphohydrolase